MSKSLNQDQNRRWNLVILVILTFVLVSCGSGNKSTGRKAGEELFPAWVEVDRKYEREVDSMVFVIKKAFSTQLVGRETAFEAVYTERDSFSYQLENGNLIYGSVMIKHERSLQWFEYYLKNSELIYSRHRAWFDDYFWGYVEEFHIYLKEGKPIYAKVKNAKGDPKYGGAGEIWLVNAETYRGDSKNLEIRLANWQKVRPVIERDMKSKAAQE
jgi:hypothetical protein